MCSWIVALLLFPLSAFAQDEADAKRNARDFDEEVIREIVRGFYVKSDIGATIYFNTHGQPRPLTGGALLSGVMSLSLGLGGDFIDQERFSAAWEVQFHQGLFNGPRTEELVGLDQPLLQGDIHTFAGTAAVEVSTYVTRRLGIGGRLGGGAIVAPLLMGVARYEEDVVEGAFGGIPAQLHEGPMPLILIGPTLEYYTKLSHFSVGIDADITYIVGFDLGLSPLGFLKYTF